MCGCYTCTEHESMCVLDYTDWARGADAAPISAFGHGFTDELDFTGHNEMILHSAAAYADESMLAVAHSVNPADAASSSLGHEVGGPDPFASQLQACQSTGPPAAVPPNPTLHRGRARPRLHKPSADGWSLGSGRCLRTLAGHVPRAVHTTPAIGRHVLYDGAGPAGRWPLPCRPIPQWHQRPLRRTSVLLTRLP
jgi:hypothetical protein